MAKLKEYNAFFYGSYNGHNKRKGGLYDLSRQQIKKFTFEHRLAFGLLESCAKSGDSIKEREFEKDFFNCHGKELCNFLKLDYNNVKHGIEQLWGCLL